MIVTLTPSPAIDWTIRLDSFDFQAINLVASSAKEASGKGVNVAWALHRDGARTLAVFPAGGDTGRFMADALAAGGLPHTIVDTSVAARTNITLVIPGHSTKINEPPVPLTPEVLERLAEAVGSACVDARWLLLCGSLPAQTPPDFYARLVSAAKRQGVAVGVDGSGEPLAQALSAGPDLIKPNVHELAQLVGGEIKTLGDAVDASRRALDLGASAVLASLGGDGALLVDRDRVLRGRVEGVGCVNSVGAGDALLAGYVRGAGASPSAADPSARLRNALLWASSAVSHPTTLFPLRPELADSVRVVEAFDRSHELSEPSERLDR